MDLKGGINNMFDFKKAIAQSEARLKSPIVEAIVLGCQGAGKSGACGTFGVKTLYIYLNAERHGAKSARTHGKTAMDAVCIDEPKDGVPIPADEAFKNLLDILSNTEAIKVGGYGAVVVDGASEVEMLIRQTSAYRAACLTSKGEHNSFLESPAVTTLLREVTSRLRRLADTGIHYAMTCILDVRALGEDGEVVEASPRLSTYSVAESLIQQFGDVVVVGRMEKDEKIAYRFQFGATVSKTSKDVRGVVKKLINFNPRISGVETLPANMKASLADVIKLKEKK